MRRRANEYVIHFHDEREETTSIPIIRILEENKKTANRGLNWDGSEWWGR